MTNIFVAGHEGMVGSAILRGLAKKENINLITASRKELDLTDQLQVQKFFSKNIIDQVYLCAAKVGGIHANNTYPADFIYQNLTIQNNVINTAYLCGVKKLLFLGSSCIYPKYASQPMNEDQLMKGYLESTNEPYAIAKIAGIKMCESYNRQYSVDYRSVMPTNLYGPGDNFHLNNSHVIPALIRRFDDAKKNNLESVTAWGTGLPRREFLFVDDMASASIYIMDLDPSLYLDKTRDNLSHINIGTGEDITIKNLTEIISNVVDYKGSILWDSEKPDGPPQKLLDVSLINSLGWKSTTTLEQGIRKTYQWYSENSSSSRK